MSKFFNETQKAHQWAQQKLANQDVDVKEMLESLKQGPASGTPLADTRLNQCRQVQVGNGNPARLVLNQGDASRAALEAYRGLRTRLMRAQAKTGLKSIAITSSLPGEGKTLTTMNLGLCYAQLPQQRVLVIDADLRTCGLTAMLEHPSTPGLAEVLAGEIAPDEAIVATNQKKLVRFARRDRFVLSSGTFHRDALARIHGAVRRAFQSHSDRHAADSPLSRFRIDQRGLRRRCHGCAGAPWTTGNAAKNRECARCKEIARRGV